MKRKEFIAGLGTAGVAGTGLVQSTARAQQSERVRRIGVLMPVLEDDPIGTADIAAFRRGLTALGWVEGRNLHFEICWGAARSNSSNVLQRSWLN
jgi:putative ABC transport system substrate-binding protein